MSVRRLHSFQPQDYLKILITPLVELFFALCDQTHFHIKSFFYYASISANIVVHFIQYCFIFYYVHVRHLFFLKKIGLLGQKELENDSGHFDLFCKGKTWCPEDENIGGIYNNTTGNIAHCPISSFALDQMMTQLKKMVDISKSKFIDFGCGSGFPCVFAMFQPFQQVVGVELHHESARLARKNLEATLQRNPDSCQCRDFLIFSQDMRHFDFSKVVTPAKDAGETASTTESIVIYLYEPLWTLPKAEAHDIYATILSNALHRTPSSVKEIYFVYLFAGMYGGAALPAFSDLIDREPDAVQLVYEEPYYGLFFGYSDNMYIYKVTLAALSAQ